MMCAGLRRVARRWAGFTAAPVSLLALMLMPMSLSAEAAALEAHPARLNDAYPDGASYMGIRLLSTVELGSARVDGLPLVELSALAWDQDEDLLYAISDNGYLFHLRPRVDGDRLTGVDAIAGFRLRDERDRPFEPKYADAEGMVLLQGDDGVAGNSELLMSFERRPRVLRMSPEGREIGPIEVAESLRQRATYTTENKALEGITLHPRWGVIAAAEWPLKGESTADYSLFALEHEARGGQGWRYPRFPAPKAGLVAMEALDDGGLLTLERAYVSLWQPMYIVLRRTDPLPVPGSATELGSTVVAEFSSHRGWAIDNFEGLTRYQGRRFLMVSDDNRKALQRTLLLLFELLPPLEIARSKLDE